MVINKRICNVNFALIKSTAKYEEKNYVTVELTIIKSEAAVKASGIATDVILSYGPFK